MERILFERPREKLQVKGAAYLSTVELLQVIIGSGNAKASAARLARRVALLFDKKDMSFTSLLSINGIGNATACQLLASIELGVRLQKGTTHALPSQRITQLMSDHRQKVLGVYLFDGARGELSEKAYSLNAKVDIKTLARDVSTDAMLANARAAIIAIGYKKAVLQPDMDDLSLIKALKEGLNTLQVTVSKIYIANGTEVYEWRGV